MYQTGGVLSFCLFENFPPDFVLFNAGTCKQECLSQASHWSITRSYHWHIYVAKSLLCLMFIGCHEKRCLRNGAWIEISTWGDLVSTLLYLLNYSSGREMTLILEGKIAILKEKFYRRTCEEFHRSWYVHCCKASIEINLGVINLIIAVLNKLFKTSVNMFYWNSKWYGWVASLRSLFCCCIGISIYTNCGGGTKDFCF